MRRAPSLLSLVALAAPASASAGEPWIDLDAAIEALPAARQDTPTGPLLGGFVRVNYAHSDDIIFTGDPDDDLGGFSLDAARIEVLGEYEGWGYFVSADAFTGSLTLLDAYVTIPCTDVITAVVGQFKTPFLRTGLIDFDRTLFIVRTRNGIFYSVRDRGVQFAVDEGAFHAQLAAQNGTDGPEDDLLLTARATWDIGGGLARSGKRNRKVEGAYGAPAEVCGEIGIAASDDQPLDDGEVLAFEGALTAGRLYLHGEVLAYGESFDLDAGGVPIPGSRSDTDPFTLTASYLVDPEHWEVALRYEDFDDDLDRALTSAGANYYRQGHDVKYQVNVYHLESDGGDEDTIAVGMTVSF